MIREGTFDQILVRPLPSLFQVVASDFALRRIGKILQAVAVLVVRAGGGGRRLDARSRARDGPLAVVAGTLIYAGVWIALATIAFWIVDAIEFVNAFTYGGNFLSAVPDRRSSAAGSGTSSSSSIPIAFVAYFPALYILDKEDELGLPDALQYASPFVAVLDRARRRGWSGENAVRHYRSAGG